MIDRKEILGIKKIIIRNIVQSLKHSKYKFFKLYYTRFKWYYKFLFKELICTFLN